MTYSLITRAGKGTPLSSADFDANMATIAADRSESIVRHIATVAVQTYWLDKAVYPYTINSLWADIKTSGSCTVAITINGTNVTSLSAVAVSTTEAETSATAANTVAIGDLVALVVSANTAALDLFARLKITRT
jgi:hypothetical protein